VHPTASARPLACPDCDALVQMPALQQGQKALCPRCTATLQVYQPNSLNRTAAFAAASAVLLVVANWFPFMTLRAGYRESQMLLWQSVAGLEEQGYVSLAGAVSLFILLAPTLLIAGLLYLILPLFWNRRLPGAIEICRAVFWARRWNMLEVFLLATLVSLLKLGKLATLSLGISFWAFVALILCLTSALVSIHPRELWDKLEKARG
jgi:paraquat-inducible protein A